VELDYTLTKLFPKVIFGKVLGNTKKETDHIVKVLDTIKTTRAHQSSAQKDRQDYSQICHVSYDKQVLKKLPKLKNKILKAVEQFKNDVFEYRQNDFVMTTSWISKTHQGESSFPHNHRNCIFSGVYYPQMDEDSAAIFFEDTGDQRINITASKWNLNNSKEVKVKPKTDTLLLFPSEVYHVVGTHKSPIPRYCIAMNFMPVGKLGDSDSYVEIQIKN
tara:strand:- start:249 stop:902 length:654 start_codon:yes stop_codon:yes gene_type:complete